MPMQFPYPPMPSTTPDKRCLVFGWDVSPNLRAFKLATGLAPIVNTSLRIPPTPVAAP